VSTKIGCKRKTAKLRLFNLAARWWRMSEDILEADEEEDENEFIEEVKSRPGVLVVLENGGRDLYSDADDDDDLVDVEVDSRLGDTSGDEDEDITDEVTNRDVVAHVDDSDSFGVVSTSASPHDPGGGISPSISWQQTQHLHAYSSPESRDYPSTNLQQLTQQNQLSAEDDEASGAGASNLSPKAESVVQSDEEIERQVQEVTEEMVDRIATECWDQVNGTYHNGQWYEWNETFSQANPYDEEMFQILPYVHTGW